MNSTSMTLSQAAAAIAANQGVAPREIRRVNVCGKRLWGRGDHGVKGQRGYEVEGVLYAIAADIVRHADQALSPCLDRMGRDLDDLDAFDQLD